MPRKEPASHPIAKFLKSRILPKLQDLHRELAARFPKLKFNVYSHVDQPATGGFDVGIECLFARHVPGTSDNVALHVDAWNIGKKPLINASMAWGPRDSQTWTRKDAAAGWASRTPKSFQQERSDSRDWPEATPETLRELEADLPRLTGGFRDCIAYAVELLG